MNEIILSAKDIVKRYDSGVKNVSAVNGVSLDIKRGESVAIVGPSGAGKSTLLHILGGLDRPTSGKVFLEDEDLYTLSDSRRAKTRNIKIGFVFQSYHLLPEFTAFENVMLPALIGGRKVGDRASSLLESVGLSDRLCHKPGELSGGESQRVAIARALVNEPQILLCDEPSGNLDSKNSEVIYKILLDLKAKSGISLVIVTHDENVARSSDRIMHIKDGHII
ncbi:MAG: ABC transporter ATP-binding protein [Candidatus Omnitrophica bacterium]|nr:ABC transporter ATP-binding protein [Candidatus Omnitrophota bacterium]